MVELLGVEINDIIKERRRQKVGGRARPVESTIEERKDRNGDGDRVEG